MICSYVNNLHRIADNSSSNQVDHPEKNNKADPFLQNSALNTQLSRPLDPRPMISEAWKTLRLSLVNFHGVPVGIIAALDSSDEKLNFDQVFVGDLVPSALAFLRMSKKQVM